MFSFSLIKRFGRNNGSDNWIVKGVVDGARLSAGGGDAGFNFIGEDNVAVLTKINGFDVTCMFVSECVLPSVFEKGVEMTLTELAG